MANIKFESQVAQLLADRHRLLNMAIQYLDNDDHDRHIATNMCIKSIDSMIYLIIGQPVTTVTMSDKMKVPLLDKNIILCKERVK